MLPEIRDQYKDIGHVEQLHGVHGEVEIVLDEGVEAADEYLPENALVYLELTGGDVIPARVSSKRIADKPDHESIFVLFDHSNSREVAAELVGADILVEREQWVPGQKKDSDKQMATPDEEEGIEELLSFSATDKNENLIGEVVNAESFPAQSLLLVELNKEFLSGLNETEAETDSEVMVPFVDEYIEKIDKERKIIVLKHIERLLGTE